MVPPPADATINNNGKRPPPSDQMYQRRAYRAALPSLDMEALFPRLENIDNTILPHSTPPAITQSQLDDTTHEAASSLLSFAARTTAIDTAATVTATVYADDVTFSPTRGGFESDSEVEDASIAGPSPPPFPTVPPIASIPQDEIDFIVEAISAVFGIVTPRDWQIEAIHHALFKEDGLLLVSREDATCVRLHIIIVGIINVEVLVICTFVLSLAQPVMQVLLCFCQLSLLQVLIFLRSDVRRALDKIPEENRGEGTRNRISRRENVGS